MSYFFQNSRDSIEHARYRMNEFEQGNKDFFDNRPYKVVIEQNDDGTEDFHKFKLVKPMPKRLPGIAFDSLNNLRSALDQAGFTCGTANNTNGKKSHFPFGDDATEVESRRTGQSKNLPKEIFDLMISFQPYKGGNNLLWALNQLCNSQKHEIIIPFATALSTVLIKEMNFEHAIELILQPKWDRTKNEMVIAHLRHGTKFKIDNQYQFFIAFAKDGVIDGKPVLGVLSALIDLVDRIVAEIEAEARRINLIT